jgi:hypothetical protein
MPEKPLSRAELAALDAPAPPPKWIRVAAYVVVGLGVLSCLTCGYVIYLVKPTVSNDPQFAQALADNILKFTPIDGYAPKGTIRWPLLSLLELRAVYYEKPDIDGTMVLIEVGSKTLQGSERVQKHLETMLREKNGVSDALQVQPKVIRVPLVVQAREREFEMSQALDPVTNVRYRIVEGTVSSLNDRTVFIGLRYRTNSSENEIDSDRLPDDVRKMLESIK